MLVEFFRRITCSSREYNRILRGNLIRASTLVRLQFYARTAIRFGPFATGGWEIVAEIFPPFYSPEEREKSDETKEPNSDN